MVHDFDAQHQYPYLNTIINSKTQFLSRWHSGIVYFGTAKTLVNVSASTSGSYLPFILKMGLEGETNRHTIMPTCTSQLPS
jgi:hypothetical protein